MSPRCVGGNRWFYQVRGIVADPVGGLVPVRARATRTNPLAARLAPPRRRCAPTLAAVVVTVLGLGSAMNLIAAVFSADVGGVLGAAVGVSLAAFGTRWVISRYKAKAASATLINRARWLWQRCWYCHRCGVVSLLMPSGSTTLHAANLGSALVTLASRLTWRPATARPSVADHRRWTP